MIQLVGYYTLRDFNRNNDSGILRIDNVSNGINEAKRQLGNLVYSASVNELSQRDKDVLVAIASFDSKEVAISDLKEKLQVTGQYLQQYKTRLVEDGLIESTRHGLIKISIPYLKEYILENNKRLDKIEEFQV
ncbi:MAG: hypothetical protein LBM13_02995 [Candidatus Ancillula sp.]|jgi:predicted transcriptional regulator|nr:hypothetical protein [Candidatus Ancillula sp.]